MEISELFHTVEIEIYLMDHDATEALHEIEKRLSVAKTALEKLANLGNGDQPGNSHGNIIAQTALKAVIGGGGL